MMKIFAIVNLILIGVSFMEYIIRQKRVCIELMTALIFMILFILKY